MCDVVKVGRAQEGGHVANPFRVEQHSSQDAALGRALCGGSRSRISAVSDFGLPFLSLETIRIPLRGLSDRIRRHSAGNFLRRPLPMCEPQPRIAAHRY